MSNRRYVILDACLEMEQEADMYVKNFKNGDLAQVESLADLTDPNSKAVLLHYFAGEEVGDSMCVDKAELVFPSGEALPKCWQDPHYRIQF